MTLASMREEIARLDVGETYARAERLDFDRTTKTQLLGALEALRNTVQAPLRRAMAETQNHYTVAAGEWRTASRDIIITVAVTRIV